MEECSRGKDLGGRSVKLAKVCEHELGRSVETQWARV